MYLPLGGTLADPQTNVHSLVLDLDEKVKKLSKKNEKLSRNITDMTEQNRELLKNFKDMNVYFDKKFKQVEIDNRFLKIQNDHLVDMFFESIDLLENNDNYCFEGIKFKTMNDLNCSEDSCLICGENLTDYCAACQEEQKTVNCFLVSPGCGHFYHLHCFQEKLINYESCLTCKECFDIPCNWTFIHRKI